MGAGALGEAIASAVRDERERCAAIADQLAVAAEEAGDLSGRAVAEVIADSIRRGDHRPSCRSRPPGRPRGTSHPAK